MTFQSHHICIETFNYNAEVCIIGTDTSIQTCCKIFFLSLLLIYFVLLILLSETDHCTHGFRLNNLATCYSVRIEQHGGDLVLR